MKNKIAKELLKIAKSLIADDTERLKEFFKSLRFPNQVSKDSSVEIYDGFVSMGFKVPDYFRARDYEEDDDFPTFTGRDKAQQIAERHFGEFIKKGYKVDIAPQEKGWMTVGVTL